MLYAHSSTPSQRRLYHLHRGQANLDNLLYIGYNSIQLRSIKTAIRRSRRQLSAREGGSPAASPPRRERAEGRL